MRARHTIKYYTKIIAQDTSYKERDARRIVAAFCNGIMKVLKRGEAVKIDNYFEIKPNIKPKITKP
jgi:nucleoid DNA-binding protein